MWNEPLAPCLTVSFEPFEADAATLIDRVVLSENEIDGFASAAVRAVAVFVTLKPSVHVTVGVKLRLSGTVLMNEPHRCPGNDVPSRGAGQSEPCRSSCRPPSTPSWTA